MKDRTPRLAVSTARSAPLLSQVAEHVLAERMLRGHEAQVALQQVPLAEREAIRLRKLIAEGIEARDELVKAHMRIAISLSRRYLHSAVELDDLHSTGFMALVSAAEHFPERARGRFAAYARGWVQQAIARVSLHARFPLQIPDRIAIQSRQLDYLIRDLEGEGELISVGYLSAVMELEPPKIRELLELHRPYLLLSTPLGAEYQLLDTLYLTSEVDSAATEAESSVASKELHARMANVLDEKALHIVCLRHGLTLEGDLDVSIDYDRSFKDIGAIVGLSPEGARYNYNHSIQRLSLEPSLAAYRDIAKSRRRSVDPNEIGSWFKG